MVSNLITHANIYTNWTSICWSSYLGMFVAVGDASSSVTSKIAYSTNGTSWTMINSPSTNNWSKVVWCDKINIFVAVSSDSTAALMTSTNGTTWAINNSLPSTSGLKDMYWDSNNLQLIIISNNTSAAQKILITKYTISNSGLELNLNNLSGNNTNSQLNSDLNMNYLVSQGGDHIFNSKLSSGNKQLLNIKANGMIGVNNVPNPNAPLDIKTLGDRAITLRTSSTSSSAFANFNLQTGGILSINVRQSNGSAGTLDLSKVYVDTLRTTGNTFITSGSLFVQSGSLYVQNGSISTTASSTLKCASSGNGVNRTAVTDYALQCQTTSTSNQRGAGLVFKMYNSSSVAVNAIGLMPYSLILTDSSEYTGLRFIRLSAGTAIGDSTNSPFSILATGGCQSSNAGGTIHSFRCENGNINSYGDISFEGPSNTWARIRCTLTSATSITNKLEFMTSLSGNDQTCLTINPNASGGDLTSIRNLTYAGSLTGPSDIRLKENIEVISNPIDKINKLRGVTFTRNDKEDKEKRYSGVLAQEVLEVLPEVVSQEGDGYYSVAYGNMVGLLIESIKEQQKQIEEQQKQIELLKQKITD